MSQVKARTLKGFRDYLPEADIPRQRMLREIARVFESFGFGPLTTPALEYSEALLGKYGAEGDKLLYRFQDNGDRDVALRYDLTVPLARVVAQHGQLERPFRRYQIAPVWRAEKPGRGRYREFLQCDVDVVGEPGLEADAECMMVGLEALKALGVPGVTMRVNNRKVLDGLLDTVGVTDRERRHAVLRAADKILKIGPEGVAAELRSEAGLDDAGVSAVLDFLALPVRALADLAPLHERFAQSPVGLEGLDELTRLVRLLESAGYGDKIALDLSIARGLDYYTGTIYESFVTDREGFGSVMSGGRYDTLLGMFLKQSVPAVGISIGVDRLLAVLVDLGLVESRAGVADVFLTLFDETSFGPTNRLAATLREAGLRVEVSTRSGKLGKQFRHAERKGITSVVVAGPDELARGEASLKNLETGDQVTVPAGDLAARIRAAE